MALPVWRGLSLCQSSGRPRAFLACETFATRANATGIDMNWWFMKFSKKTVPKMPEKPKEVPFQCVTVQQQPPLCSPNWNATVPVNCLHKPGPFWQILRISVRFCILCCYFHYRRCCCCIAARPCQLLNIVKVLPLPVWPWRQEHPGLSILFDSDPQFVAKSN